MVSGLYAYTPQWFYGKELLIDVVSACVLLLIAFFSLRYFKVDRKNKNYLYLASSFLLIALSFTAKILTNFTINYHVLETINFGTFSLVHRSIKTSDALFFAGYLFHRILMLLGLYALYSIYQKHQSRANMFIAAFLIIVSVYFSKSEYYTFHLTALLLLILVTKQFYINFRKSGQFTAKLLAISFAVISASQIFFMFAGFGNIIYAAAGAIQLGGYSLLLVTFIRVLYDAKKKK